MMDDSRKEAKMDRTSRMLVVLAGVALLAGDFAALDDITTGSEPGLVLEWFFVAVSIPILFVLGRLALRGLRHQPR